MPDATPTACVGLAVGGELCLEGLDAGAERERARSATARTASSSSSSSSGSCVVQADERDHACRPGRRAVRGSCGQPQRGGRRRGVTLASSACSARRPRWCRPWIELSVRPIAVGDLAGREPDDVAQDHDAALLVGQRRERLAQATASGRRASSSARSSAPKTSSAGIARRRRRWSIATLCARRSSQAKNGTPRSSYLHEDRHQLREDLLRDVLGLVARRARCCARSRRCCARSARTGSGSRRGRRACRAPPPRRGSAARAACPRCVDRTRNPTVASSSGSGSGSALISITPESMSRRPTRREHERCSSWRRPTRGKAVPPGGSSGGARVAGRGTPRWRRGSRLSARGRNLP